MDGASMIVSVNHDATFMYSFWFLFMIAGHWKRRFRNFEAMQENGSKRRMSSSNGEL